MKYRNIYLLIVFISSLMLGKTVYGADPSAFNVTVYKTEICQDTTCTTILDDSSGVAVDLITGTGAFGSSPSVAAGSYNTFRFTMANAGTFSGSNTGCTGTQTAIDQSFVINGALAATDPVTIAFSTSDAAIPGATGWYANGSDASPYLLTAPVVIEPSMATSITMQFNTANTLSCDTSNNIAIAPPTVSVSSTVVPSSVVFTGGEYWLGGLGIRTPDYLFAVRDYAPGSIISGAYPPAGVTILTGEQINSQMIGDVSVFETLLNETATGDGALYRAQVRSNSRREYKWGAKVRFNPPDANGVGTVDIIRDGGEHRHALTVGFNDSFTPAATADATTPIESAGYEIDAYNGVTISVPGMKQMSGAFSRDYEVFYLGQVDDGINILMAIKVATGSTTFPTGDYYWNQYGMGLDRQEVVDAIENGNEIASSMWNYADIGWLTFDGTDVTAATLRSEVSVTDPTSTTPTLTTQPGDSMFVDAISALGLTMTDGAGYMAGNDGTWAVVSPSGDNIMTVSDGVQDSTGTGNYTHRLSSMFNSRLATVGSTTAADLAGRYYMAGMDDSTSADWVNFKGSVGEVVLTASSTSSTGGTGIYGATSLDHNNVIQHEGAPFDWEITTICLGVAADAAASTGFTRIPTTTAPCTAPVGGAAKAVDIISLRDQTTGDEFVQMFISSSGNVLSFYDTGNVEVGGNSATRSLGTLVRLED